MRSLAALLLAVSLGGTAHAVRQAGTAGPAPVTRPFDHVHVAVAEPERAAAWYIRLLGAGAAATADRVWFGDVLLIFQKTSERRSGAAGPVAHMAFAVPDIPASVAALTQDGARVLAKSTEVPGLFKAALLEDPWGVPIEIVEGPAPGLHHVHLNAADPAGTLDGYERLFGGVRAQVGRTGALQYGGMFLLVQPGTPVTGPTAIDHISWRVDNVDEATSALRARGVTVLREPGTSPGGNRVSFVEGPGGARIEVMQRSR